MDDNLTPMERQYWNSVVEHLAIARVGVRWIQKSMEERNADARRRDGADQLLAFLDTLIKVGT